MNFSSSVASLVLFSIGFIPHAAQSLVVSISPHRQPSQSKIAIKPPVTLQVRQNQAKGLISQLMKQQIISINDEKSPQFMKSFDDLRVGLLTGQDTAELGGYKYTIETKGNSVVLHTATPKLPKLKSYFGLVHTYASSAQLKISELLLCESKKAQRKQPIKIADITIRESGLVCPLGYQKYVVVQPPAEK
jgi:hypothetical protein